MLGMQMPETDRWSGRVSVVLGLNPGPFTGPGTNTYLIGTGAARVLLDTGQGVDGYLPLLERGLHETAGADSLQEIVLTHAHPDHIGGVHDILGRFGALRVSKRLLPEQDRGLTIVALDDGDEVSGSGVTLRAIWTPGHARDHLCFYMPEEKALFSGDVVLGAGTTVIPRDGDLGDYLRSLERLLTLDLEVIYPAHGPAIRNPQGKIRDYIAHRALRDRQIRDVLAAGPSTVEKIVAAIYCDVPEFLHGAAAVSVEAHLRKMLSDEVVNEENGRWRLLSRA